MTQHGYESGYDPSIPLFDQATQILSEEAAHRKEIAGKLVTLGAEDPEVFVALCRTEGYDSEALLPALKAELED